MLYFFQNDGVPQFFLMVWYADIIIFGGFVVMCMYIR